MTARNWLLCAAFAVGDVESTSTTTYFAVMGDIAPTIQASMQQVVRDSLTVSNMFVRVIANGITANSIYTFMIGAANGNNTVTFGSGETGTKQDTTHSDSLVAGNLISNKIATGATGTTITTSIVAYQLQHASSDVPILGNAGGALVANSATVWLSLLGQLDYATPEAFTAYKVEVAGTLSNMRVYVNANTNTRDGTLTSRINSAAGTQTVTITGSGTGSFEDTSNTDSVSVAQTIGMQIATGAKLGTTTRFTVTQYKYAATGQIIGSGYGSPTEIAFDKTYFFPFGNALADAYATTTEANAQVNGLFSSTFAHMFVYVSVYSLDAAATVALRQNGGSSALTVSPNATGVFEDTTHTVSIISTDLLCSLLDTNAASSGTIAMTYIGYELQQPAAAPAAKPRSFAYIIG